MGFFWPSEPSLAHDPITSHGEMDSQLITVLESIPKPQEARHKNIEQPDFANNRRLVIRKPREESLSPASHKRTQSRPNGNKNERVKTSKTPARKTQELKLPPYYKEYTVAGFLLKTANRLLGPINKAHWAMIGSRSLVKIMPRCRLGQAAGGIVLRTKGFP